MTRGHGQTQQECTALLRRRTTAMSTKSITVVVYGEATPAAENAVRRALKRLVAEKKVEERPRLSARGGRRWAWRRRKAGGRPRVPKTRIPNLDMDELPGIDGSRDPTFDLGSRNLIDPLNLPAQPQTKPDNDWLKPPPPEPDWRELPGHLRAKGELPPERPGQVHDWQVEDYIRELETKGATGVDLLRQDRPAVSIRAQVKARLERTED